MKRHQLLFLIISLLALTCKKEPPPAVHIPTLALTAVDASCTEAWLKLTTTQLPATVRLVRLTPTLQTLQTLQLTTPDTLLIDEGLLPNQTYTYKAYRLEVRGSVVDSSTQATVSTMDTTSHNFTWQLDTLGTHSSVLYDVAIINDTLVYAVGEIFHRDSSENWTFFNLAKWNGREWTLQRVYYRGNNIIHTRWILAFAWNDIWITPYTHWDGTTWREVPFDPIFSGVGTNKAWGTSSSDFYVVGDGGFIAHYDGVRWRRIESGTDATLNDAWGVKNSITRQTKVVVAAGNKFTGGATMLLLLRDGVLEGTLPWPFPVRPRYSVWMPHLRKVYTCGSGVFTTTSQGWHWYNGLPAIFTNRIRGTTYNNIFVAGDFGLLAHFNGVSWYVYQNLGLGAGVYESLAVAQALAVAVGYSGSRAIAVCGKPTQTHTK
jgi:hypothetical protein